MYKLFWLLGGNFGAIRVGFIPLSGYTGCGFKSGLSTRVLCDLIASPNVQKAIDRNPKTVNHFESINYLAAARVWLAIYCRLT